MLVAEQGDVFEALRNQLATPIQSAFRGTSGAQSPVSFFAFIPSEIEGFEQDPELVEKLVSAPLVIIDMSLGQSAYFALGVRHSLSNGATLALSAQSGPHSHEVLSLSQPDFDARLHDRLRNISNPYERDYSNALQRSKTFRTVPIERTFPKSELNKYCWMLPRTKTESWRRPEIFIWKGSIQNITKVQKRTEGKEKFAGETVAPFSVWVNSENTYMEMARFWDSSISAQIRRLGAVMAGPLDDQRLKDRLGIALAEKMGTRNQVEIGHTFLTPTDEASDLYNEFGVEHIVHLAAVEPRKTTSGFRSGGKIREGITSIFKTLQNESGRGEKSFFGRNRGRPTELRQDLSSVLIPMIGSGDGGQHPSFVAHQIVAAIKDLLVQDRAEALANPANKDDWVPKLPERIGLVAFMPSHERYLIRELDGLKFERSEHNLKTPGR